MIRFFSAIEVLERLRYDACIEAVRQAMIDHSSGRTQHLLRSFIGMGKNRSFAQMPAVLSAEGWFGAKLVSVFADPANPAHRAHRGLVVLFEAERGEPVCVADAGAVTLVRTACATAVATDALARPDARVLALIGTGEQAKSHLRALPAVRDFKEIIVWGRDGKRTGQLVEEARGTTGLPVNAASSVREAVRNADVVCTLTSASEPVLLGEWLPDGVHVNLVGSSAPGPTEVDEALVAKSRFIADCREHVRSHGAEFLRAKAAGLVDEGHIAAEIGEVLAGRRRGRRSAAEITVYKSLGHAVQDLAAVAWLYRQESG